MEEDRAFIPLYPNWIELMETKDTDAKQVAFLHGIIDAFRGEEPPRPSDIENPHGTDYARRDGYLVAKPMVNMGLRTRGGQPGNKNACKHRKPQNDEPENKGKNESETNKKRIRNDRNESYKEEEEKEKENNTHCLSTVCVKRAHAQDAETDGGDEKSDRPLHVPSDEEMRDMTIQTSVPLDYLPAFVADIQDSGWGYVNRLGEFVSLTRRNFKSILRSFYRQHLRNADKAKEPGQTIGVKIEAEGDYEDRF